jgi:hypothetical protein
MTYTFEQISDIIKLNPSKGRIEKGRKMADKLMLHVQGVGMSSALPRCDYFENIEAYKVRKQYAISNKDLYSRLLQQEDMIFSAKGGSTSFNLPEGREKQMNAVLENVRYGMSLRKWIQTFALPAYRCDPMGVFLMEVEKMDPNSVNPQTPKTYPTYKSIYSIYNYDTTGRRLEHVAFRLTAGEALSFGVKDDELKQFTKNTKTTYYRFIDDAKDIIVKWSGNEVDPVMPVDDTIENIWKRVPGFIISDLMQFNDPECFLSPLDYTTELADCFLYDRSVRDLQKKYHGFSKAVEPLMTCGKCAGTGYLAGKACPDCSSAGADKGTGYKMQTKVSDVARFPLEMAESRFDFRNFFGYVSPDVQGWEKQDTSLADLANLIELTYWGTSQPQQVTGAKKVQEVQETATKTMTDLQPRYSRLNKTADWAEKTEILFAEFIGQFWFREGFKKAAIAYGRYYVLETPDQLMDQYLDLRTKGAPESALYEALEKYYHAIYQNSPMELAYRLKLLYVEPFPHLRIGEVKAVATDQLDINCKLYFGEWYSTISDIEVIVTDTNKLREKLKEFVKAKNLPEPEPVKPALN